MQDQLIIFDCDGVLVDSEVISARCVAEALTDLGLPLTAREVLQRFQGVSMQSMRASVEAELGRLIDGEVFTRLEDRILAAFAAELAPVAGVPQMVRRLSQLPGYARCVGSSSSERRIRKSLEYCELWRAFRPNVFSAEQVDRGKPAPDLFLFAASQMGIPPARCTVVEDSAVGVRAALAAGMRPIGFTGGSHIVDEATQELERAGAAAVVETMLDLVPLLQSRLA